MAPHAPGGEVFAQLAESHENLDTLLDVTDDATLRTHSACAEWTIAQVAAHIGAGAGIAQAALELGLEGTVEPVTGDAMQAVWAAYDSLNGQAAVRRALAADRSLDEALNQLSQSQLAEMRVPFFSGPVPVTTFAAFRLSEHAVHTWDIETARRPHAELALPAAATILETVVMALVARLATPVESAVSTLAVRLDDTGQELALSLGDPVSLADRSAGETPDATLTTTTPAFVRLIYGRLSADRTPTSIELVGPITLEHLRNVFPGF